MLCVSLVFLCVLWEALAKLSLNYLYKDICMTSNLGTWRYFLPLEHRKTWLLLNKIFGVPCTHSVFCPVMQLTSPACMLSAYLHYPSDQGPGAPTHICRCPCSWLLWWVIKSFVSNPGILGLLLTFMTLVFSDSRILVLTLGGLTCQHVSLVKPYAPCRSWKLSHGIVILIS